MKRNKTKQTQYMAYHHLERITDEPTVRPWFSIDAPSGGYSGGSFVALLKL